MEESRNVTTDITAGVARNPPEPKKKRVSILSVGVRLLVAVVILVGAAYYANSLISNQPAPMQRQQRERSFTVAVMEPELGTFAPKIGSFGQVVAGRTIDLRARAAGEVVEVSPKLVTGGRVDAGEVLLRIDDFDYVNAAEEAQAALINARFLLAEAEQQVNLQTIAADLADRQFQGAERDLERAQSLLESGSVTSQEVETRELAVAERQQALQQARSSLAIARTDVARQQAAIESARRTLEQANRTLSYTTITAPFNGVVVSESAELGRTYSQSEAIATLYDAGSLEVSFLLSDQQYGQLTSAGLMGRPVTIIWDIDPEPITLTGEVTRAGAEVDAALGGVEVFATLSGEARTPLRPGTFVEVQVDGLDFENALRIPETALYENDHFYTIREGRMARVDAQLLARDGAMLIVQADVPEGERIILTHLAQAGEGVAVVVEGEEPMQVWGGRPDTPPAEGQDEGGNGEGERREGAGGPQGGDGERTAGGPDAPPAEGNE